MTMKITPDSHLDHGLTPEQVDFITTRFADRDGFFIESFELPTELGTVPCALIGPVMGNEPVLDELPETYETSGLDIANPDIMPIKRGNRTHYSRILLGTISRPTRTVTVIAGPHGDDACVLYTAFGGPLAPKESADPTLKEEERGASEDFWSEHALAEDVLAEEDWARWHRESAQFLQGRLVDKTSGIDLGAALGLTLLVDGE